MDVMGGFYGLDGRMKSAPMVLLLSANISIFSFLYIRIFEY